MRIHRADRIEEVAKWVSTKPPFNLEQLGAEYAAVLLVADVTETLTGTAETSEGTADVTVKGTRQMIGTSYPYGNPRVAGYFLTMLGEQATELLDLGYIQKNYGDGFGFEAGILDVLLRQQKGLSDYDDVIRLNVRAPESPTAVKEAVYFFLGR